MKRQMKRQRLREWRSLNIEMERMSKEASMVVIEHEKSQGFDDKDDEIIRPIEGDPWKHLFPDNSNNVD